MVVLFFLVTAFFMIMHRNSFCMIIFTLRQRSKRPKTKNLPIICRHICFCLINHWRNVYFTTQQFFRCFCCWQQNQHRQTGQTTTICCRKRCVTGWDRVYYHSINQVKADRIHRVYKHGDQSLSRRPVMNIYAETGSHQSTGYSWRWYCKHVITQCSWVNMNHYLALA